LSEIPTPVNRRHYRPDGDRYHERHLDGDEVSIHFNRDRARETAQEAREKAQELGDQFRENRAEETQMQDETNPRDP